MIHPKKILIANRGEIAVRIIRTATRMGIKTVAVYSEDDKDSLHVVLADESSCLKGNSLADTYLNQDKLIQLAKKYHVTAIHPGYGFLSENADFAAKVEGAGLIFIGARPEQIRLMGEKKTASGFVQKLGIPVIPGLRGDKGMILSHKEELEFPLLIKASGGGGGKGMVICHSSEELNGAIDQAERQAIQYFGNGELMAERYLPDARHIEVQLMGDGNGKILHFFERDCSIQRRYQKVIEEAPAVAIPDQLCRKLEQAALLIGEAVKYRGAGTIEFLVDQKNRFYFLEMNTRIQVEHPVSEMITGMDLIELQLKVAFEQKLVLAQSDIKSNGHAIELRICAEDPSKEFVPVPGHLERYAEPVTARWDSFMNPKMAISTGYDSLLGKLVVYASDRTEAINKLDLALDELFTGGLVTNQEYLKGLIGLTDYRENRLNTNFIKNHQAEIYTELAKQKALFDPVMLGTAYLIDYLNIGSTDNTSLWSKINFRRLYPEYQVQVSERILNLFLRSRRGNQCLVKSEEDCRSYKFKRCLNGQLVLEKNDQTGSFFICPGEKNTIIQFKSFLFPVKSYLRSAEIKLNKQRNENNKSIEKLIKAPLYGKVLRIETEPAQKITGNDVILVLESMKTEFKIMSPHSGIVKSINVKEGQIVKDGELLAEIEF